MQAMYCCGAIVAPVIVRWRRRGLEVRNNGTTDMDDVCTVKHTAKQIRKLGCTPYNVCTIMMACYCGLPGCQGQRSTETRRVCGSAAARERPHHLGLSRNLIRSSDASQHGTRQARVWLSHTMTLKCPRIPISARQDAAGPSAQMPVARISITPSTMSLSRTRGSA